MIVELHITGVPQGQGNKTVYNGRVVEGRRPGAREAFAAWRGAIITKAREAAETHGAFPDAPLHLALTFWMPRPASARKGDVWCAKRPDIDKLERAVCDALTLSGLIPDDSRIVTVAKAKPYADNRPPGVDITVATKA